MKCFPDPCGDLAGVNQQVLCARNWPPQTSVISSFGGSRRTRREERGLGCGPAGEAEVVQTMGEGGRGGGTGCSPTGVRPFPRLPAGCQGPLSHL